MRPPMAALISRPPRALAVAITLAVLHGVNDAYHAFLPPLLPRLMGTMTLSVTEAATLAAVLSLAASLAQPVLGHLADRYGRRKLVVLGPVASGVFLSTIGFAPGFWTLMGLLVLGGLGSAAFHPPGASIAVRASEGRGSGMRHAVFSFGGSAGFAVGPLVAVGLVGALGLEGLWVAAIPVVVLAAVLWPILPKGGVSGVGATHPSIAEVADLLRGPVGLVFGVSAASAFLQRMFITMEPIIVAEAGGSETAGAVALTVYLAAQAAGTLTGGFLADRMDRRRLMAGLTILALPTHLLAFGLPAGSAGSLAAAAAGGLVNQAILPPVVVIALEVAPRRAAMSSGIVMGLAWALGTMGVPLVGVLADLVGSRSASMALTPVILLGTWLGTRPTLRRHGRPLGETAATLE